MTPTQDKDVPMRELTVGIVFTSRTWRAALQRFVRDHAAGVAVRVIRDQRMAVEEQVDIVLVDADTSFLTAGLVTALRDRGVKFVGVVDPTDAAADTDIARLRSMGVEETVSAETPPGELLVQLRGRLPDINLDQQFGELVAGLELGDVGSEGQIIAVGGPPGSGATEVAVALSDSLSSTDPAVLLDADEVNAGIARRLHLTLHPHLLTAIDDLRSSLGKNDVERDDPVSSALARPAAGGALPPFDVVVGLANRQDWQVLHEDELSSLIDSLCARWRYVVINLGPHLEDLGRWVDRFLASRTAAAEADVVVGVCEASPRGLLRFFDWLVELEPLADGRPVHAVVNRAPRSAFRRAEVAEQLHEHAGPRIASLTIVPEDRRVPVAAWDGVLVPRGPFTRAISELASTFAPRPQPRRLLTLRSRR